VVSPANFNSPQQTVVAGDAAAVERACTLARESGARRAIPLPVSAPFHCALMAPAADKLAPELAHASFRDARPPVVTNVEAAPETRASRFPELLRAQITAPVRFTEMIERLAGEGVTRVLEVGPGRVLSGLVARIDKRIARAGLSGAADLVEAKRFAESRG
jgi:[acyl-carrier-protein] S-malonyltransferase